MDTSHILTVSVMTARFLLSPGANRVPIAGAVPASGRPAT